MMKRKKNITEEIDKTLSLMDSVENLDVNPFLYTRVKTGIEGLLKSSEDGIFSNAFKILRLSLFVLLFSFNLYSVLVYIQSDKGTNEMRQEYLDSIRTEYTLSTGYYSDPTGGDN